MAKKNKKPRFDIGKLPVFDHPDVINGTNPITDDIRHQYKSTHAKLLIQCEKEGLMTEFDWIPNKPNVESSVQYALDIFISDMAGHQVFLDDLMSSTVLKSQDKRHQRWELMKRFITVGKDAGYTRYNLSFILPVFAPASGDTKYNRDYNKKFDDSDIFATRLKNKKMRRVTKRFEYDAQVWEHVNVKERSKPTKVRSIDIPPTYKVFTNQFNRSIDIMQKLKEMGGVPYMAYEWLRRHNSTDLKAAVEYSYRKLAQDLKAQGPFTRSLQEVLDTLEKHYPKMTRQEIFEVIYTLFDRMGDDFSATKLKKSLDNRTRLRKPILVWDEHLNYTQYPSIQVAAETLGQSVDTLVTYKSSGKPKDGLYFTDIGQIPDALNEKYTGHQLVETFMNLLDTHLFDDCISQKESQLVTHVTLHKNLKLTGELFNLPPNVVLHKYEKAMLSITNHLLLLKANERAETETNRMDAIPTSVQNRDAAFKQRTADARAAKQAAESATSESTSFPADSSGASNLSKSTSETDKEVDLEL